MTYLKINSYNNFVNSLGFFFLIAAIFSHVILCWHIAPILSAPLTFKSSLSTFLTLVVVATMLLTFGSGRIGASGNLITSPDKPKN